MDIQLNDILEMKKPHPCGKEGCKKFLVLRIGMDFRLRCEGCGHEVMYTSCNTKLMFSEKEKE